MGKFLDQAGALYIVTKIKGLLDKKVDKEEGKTLTDVNFTAALKEKLDGIAEGANKYSHPTTSGNKHIPTGGKSGQILRWSSDGTASWGEDKDTTYSPMTPASTTETGKAGLVPAPTAGSPDRYLRSDGTWSVPSDTKYAAMKGATASAGGTAGLVPAPAAGQQAKFLRADGTWQTPENTTYNDATQSKHGLMSPEDKKKLDAFGSASDYAKKTDIADVYKYKGSVATESELPKSPARGDVYNIEAASSYGNEGMNVAWNGTTWDSLGSVFKVETISNTEIDAMFS